MPWERMAGAREEPVALRALCILRRASQRGEPVFKASQMPAARAFTAVVSHACCFSLENGERKRQMLRTYLRLAVEVPVLEVKFQPGMKRLHQVLDGIEQAVRQFT